MALENYTDVNLEQFDLGEIEESAKEITGRIVGEINESEVAEGIAEGIIKSLPDEILNKLSLVLDVGKIFLIVLIIYLIILIIRIFVRMSDSRNLEITAKSTNEMNKKLDVIILQNDKLFYRLDKKKDRKDK